MNRFLITQEILREDLHPFKNQLKHFLHEHKNHGQFFCVNYIYHRYQRVYIKIELSSDELSHLNGILKVLELLYYRFFHFIFNKWMLNKVYLEVFSVSTFLLPSISFSVSSERSNSLSILFYPLKDFVCHDSRILTSSYRFDHPSKWTLI